MNDTRTHDLRRGTVDDDGDDGEVARLAANPTPSQTVLAKGFSTADENGLPLRCLSAL